MLLLHSASVSSSWLRRVVSLKRVGAGCVLTCMTAAWYYRPVALTEEEKKGKGALSSISKAPNRSNEFFCSDRLFPIRREESPWLLEMARTLTIGVTTIAIRVFMNTYGSYDLDTSDEHYVRFLETVLGHHRTKGQGMLTVSNHRSLFDDPGVVSCILPLWLGIQPKYNRWGVCSQEYCFNDALPGILKGYIGAGQVLPICRGAGINQSLLHDFARLLAAGEWCHIFPEGGAWQLPSLGGRATHNQHHHHQQKGKLKWGVGKLIAHAPVCPKVIPFAHVGMEAILPQDPKTRRTYFQLANPHVKIKFGPEIHFDDLIHEYESKHGPLWKYSPDHDPTKTSTTTTTNVPWQSSDQEKELYRKIALRIEQELEQVTKAVVASKYQQSLPNNNNVTTTKTIATTKCEQQRQRQQQ